MDTERYQALMDTIAVLLRALGKAEHREGIFMLSHAIDHIEEAFRADEVKA